MSGFRDKWRVRGRLHEVEIEVRPEAVDLDARTASRAELETLLWLFDAGDREVERAILEVHARLSGVSRVDSGRTSVLRGPSRLEVELVKREIREHLKAAAMSGLLVVTREKRPKAGVPPAPAPPPLRPAAVAQPPTWFSLTVVDEVDRGIDGVKVAFDVTGDRLIVPTNGAGEARLDDVEGTRVVGATLVSLPEVRAKLVPRWDRGRKPAVPTGANVVVRELPDAVSALSIPAEKKVKLVVTPRFECHQVDGTHFEFGRSFVRSSAIDPLSEIAEALSGDDGRKGMIFGHTDLSGSEALNKALSERRAKAIYALFTQNSDMWEELYSGSQDDPNWHEKWDLEEAQHMLNALGCTDDAGQPLAEDGVRGPRTIQAIHRFQSGDYPDCPAEQALLAASETLGVDGRKELFLAYAKRVSRKPVDAARIDPVGGAKYMGCGEYNPLSLTITDAESRRTVVFVYDGASAPTDLPCALGSLGPCQSNCGPLPTAADPNGAPPYRCAVYQEVAKKCPCNGGLDLSHDFAVVVPMSLESANALPHAFTLVSDDGTYSQTRTLASDCRATDDEQAEFVFSHVPEIHAYSLVCNDGDETYALFDKVPYAKLPEVLGLLDDSSSALPSLSDPDDTADADDSAGADDTGGADDGGDAADTTDSNGAADSGTASDDATPTSADDASGDDANTDRGTAPDPDPSADSSSDNADDEPEGEPDDPPASGHPQRTAAGSPDSNAPDSSAPESSDESSPSNDDAAGSDDDAGDSGNS